MNGLPIALAGISDEGRSGLVGVAQDFQGPGQGVVGVARLLKIIEVVELLYNRVEAKVAVTKYKDLTPEEDTQAFKSMFHAPTLKRDRGTGRPTKKDRRDTDELIGGMFGED